MTQSGQTEDKKEITRLRKVLERLQTELAEKDKLLHLANQKVDHLQEERTKLRGEISTFQEKEHFFVEQSTTLKEKEVRLALADQEAEHFKAASLRMSIIQHGLSILTAISLGVGINYVTSPPTATHGLILIFFGIGAESISFYITFSGAQKNHP